VTIQVRTQEDLDAAVADGHTNIECVGDGTFTIDGSASVWAYDSATVRAYGSATVWAYGSVTVRASAFVAVHIHGDTPRVDGGVQIRVPHLTDAADWCNYHDIPVDGETVVLHKAVRDDWRSAHGTSYAPGASPVADDWEPSRSCGGGLHLVALPWEGCRYDSQASRFVGCRVRLDEVVVIDVEKVKVPRVLECFAVDIDGEVVS
jgi:hypothetical protein